MKDRRAVARFAPAFAPDTRATLRPGCAAVLVDVSEAGTLIQAPRALRPGARVHLQVHGSSMRVAVAGHVLRCMVWSLDPAEGITYRGAVQFDHPVIWRWAEQTRSVHPMPEHAGPARANGGKTIPAGRSLPGAAFQER